MTEHEPDTYAHTDPAPSTATAERLAASADAINESYVAKINFLFDESREDLVDDLVGTYLTELAGAAL